MINPKAKITTFQTPFPHIIIGDFLIKEKVEQILQAVQQEEFIQKDADLFQFKQTNDLEHSKNRILQSFRKELLNDILKIEELTNTKLKKNKIDFAASLYQDTDYLLCHDDQLEKRKVAYIYYLTSLKKTEGGTLNLFASKNNLPLTIAKKIVPQKNTIIFFEVLPTSFHEVEEIIKTVDRLSINGWFYAKD